MTLLKSLNDHDLQRILELVKQDTISQCNCHRIGIIETVYTDPTLCADIQLVDKFLQQQASNGDLMWIQAPLFHKVPIAILHGGTGRITFPIAQGDECTLFFNDRDITNWYLSGGVNALDTLRTHDFSDVFAVVDKFSVPNAPTDYDPVNVVLAGNMNFNTGVSATVPVIGVGVLTYTNGLLTQFDPY